MVVNLAVHIQVEGIDQSQYKVCFSERSTEGHQVQGGLKEEEQIPRKREGSSSTRTNLPLRIN